MNANQRKYAVERVAAIKTVRLGRLQDAHSALYRKISDEKRCDLVRSGKVKLLPEVTTISSYSDVVKVFDFSKYEGHTDKQIADHKAAVAALEAEASSVRDQIMLGDAEIALALLNTFAA